MIYDKISNWGTYFKNPIFKKIFSELEKLSICTEDGVYMHDGFYFKVMTYNTKESPEIIETHRKEVDIQLVLRGNERIKMYHPEDLAIKTEYSIDNDSIFYTTTKLPYSEIILHPEYMAVFFPSDPHHPQFQVNNQEESLKKIVIKVNLEHFI